MADIINHKELAESRLATQFRDSTNLIAYIKALLVEANTLEQVFQDLLDKRWIDTAEGAQLDIIGAIVGQPRILLDATILSYFGFAPNAASQSFGTIDNVSVGGRFRSVLESTTGNRSLTDTEYRDYIRARIIKNSITPTVQAMTDFLKSLFNVDQVIIVDGDMQYTVQIGRILTANEKAFILNTDLIPKVAAVGVNYQEYELENAFGFGGVPTSLGFGSVTNPNIGGKFAATIS